MATKGILSKPPAKQTAAERAAAVERKRIRDAARPAKNMQGLSAPQTQSIENRQTGDIALGNTANANLDNIQQSYSQPFDWNALPTAPVQGDFNTWRQGQIDSTYQDFSRRTDPQFKQQADDFEQQMANRGIGIGSEQYNREKSRMEQSQSDARSSALVQAQGLAGQNAQQFFDIGNQSRANAYTDATAKRNMPLAEYNALYGATSGMDANNLGYSQNLGLQNNQAKQNVWQAKNTPRGGGGGGGSDPYQGFGSAQELWAAQDARARGNSQWQWENQPKQSSGPSYGAQVGGSLLGTGLGILGNYYMS